MPPAQAIDCEIVSTTYTVVEYGHLHRGSVAGNGPGDLRNPWIDPALWDDLEQQVSDAAANGERATLYPAGRRNGVERLRVGNHIGVLATPNGSLEILPKLARVGEGMPGREVEGAELRNVVKRMLATVLDLNFRQTGPASQDREDTLFEWFITVFLSKALRLVHRGLRSSYETLEDNLPVLRGRLVLNQHLRRNAADTSRLYVRFDEFTPNRPENRLMHAALRRAWSASRDADNRRLARELMAAFADVPPSTNVETDFKAWRLERGADHYLGLREWCHALLSPYATAPTRGELNFESFLFPADVLFERYVAERMYQALPKATEDGGRITMDTQVIGKSLFSKDGSRPFGRRYDLRPDIVISRQRQGQQHKELLICDTKWKLYEGTDRSGTTSSADLYQLYVYASYWGAVTGSTVQVALIAPKSPGLREVTGPHRFDDGAKPVVELWMVPYDLLTRGGSIDMGSCRSGDSLLHSMVTAHQAVHGESDRD